MVSSAETVRALLHELQQAWSHMASAEAVRAAFNPGVPPETLAAAELRLGHPLPEEARVWWSWCDGTAEGRWGTIPLQVRCQPLDQAVAFSLALRKHQAALMSRMRGDISTWAWSQAICWGDTGGGFTFWLVPDGPRCRLATVSDGEFYVATDSLAQALAMILRSLEPAEWDRIGGRWVHTVNDAAVRLFGFV
jgi:hypothetical protein